MGFLDALTGAGSGFMTGAATGVPHLAGIGAVVGGLGGLFGGGGGGSSGGGGGGAFAGALPQPYGPAMDYLDKYFESNFGIRKDFGPKDLNKFEEQVDKGGIDKYTALNFYDNFGVQPADKAYQNILFDTVKKSDAKNIAGLLGKQFGMFSGVSPGNAEIDELYELGKLTGKTGSPQEFSNFLTQTLSMDPRYRQPSGREFYAGLMKGGPLVNVGGTMQFKGTPRSQRMFDKIDQGNKMYYDRIKGGKA